MLSWISFIPKVNRLLAEESFCIFCNSLLAKAVQIEFQHVALCLLGSFRWFLHLKTHHSKPIQSVAELQINHFESKINCISAKLCYVKTYSYAISSVGEQLVTCTGMALCNLDRPGSMGVLVASNKISSTLR